MVLSQYDGAGCRPGRLWRGVLPYGLITWTAIHSGTRIEHVERSALTQKRLIENVGDGVCSTPNSGHVAAPQ